MLFKEFGDKNAPAFIALHGGGLSWWSLRGIIDLLAADYHVIAPVIDGHGEDAATTFVSIQDSVRKLIASIDRHLDGKAFAISGLSIGAQIVIEALSQRPRLAEYAIIESASVIPVKAVPVLAAPAYSVFYGVIKSRRFAKMQANALNLPAEMFDEYYRDSVQMSKESLINIALSNGSYGLNPDISTTAARTLILAGGKERKFMLESARKLRTAIPQSRLCIAENMAHGELSLRHPDVYVDMIRKFIADNRSFCR
ncbi:MAG: alpha/beta hydrolase [Clostridiales Family XIII bacterium]|jgi:pimeloyl-ACP methyl ester carboxylesterase|nr:alpha/beta hydrolase [Clostridiales Family XIII bacterium]